MGKSYSRGSVLLMVVMALGLVAASVSTTLYLVYNQPGTIPQMTPKVQETKLAENLDQKVENTSGWNQELQKEVAPTPTPTPTSTPTPKPSPTPKPAESVKTEAKKDTTITATSVNLTAEGIQGGVKLNWTVEGNSPKGFKVAKSQNPNPTYPTREGDAAQYLSSPEARSYTWEGLTLGTTYHFRVGIYNGSGGVVLYSNDVTATVK